MSVLLMNVADFALQSNSELYEPESVEREVQSTHRDTITKRTGTQPTYSSVDFFFLLNNSELKSS